MFLKDYPKEVYEGQLGKKLEIFCIAADSLHAVACRARRIHSDRDLLCEARTELPHEAGRTFIIESLSVADLGIYQCGTVSKFGPVTNTNFTIKAGKSGAQVFEFIMSPNYGLVPCAPCMKLGCVQ